MPCAFSILKFSVRLNAEHKIQFYSRNKRRKLCFADDLHVVKSYHHTPGYYSVLQSCLTTEVVETAQWLFEIIVCVCMSMLCAYVYTRMYISMFVCTYFCQEYFYLCKHTYFINTHVRTYIYIYIRYVRTMYYICIYVVMDVSMCTYVCTCVNVMYVYMYVCTYVSKYCQYHIPMYVCQ
jgi:hypothetical protein